jgi:hypothetical protein
MSPILANRPHGSGSSSQLCMQELIPGIPVKRVLGGATAHHQHLAPRIYESHQQFTPVRSSSRISVLGGSSLVAEPSVRVECSLLMFWGDDMALVVPQYCGVQRSNPRISGLQALQPAPHAAMICDTAHPMIVRYMSSQSTATTALTALA